MTQRWTSERDLEDRTVGATREIMEPEQGTSPEIASQGAPAPKRYEKKAPSTVQHGENC